MVGWCDGAGLTSSSGASYNFDYSRARANCTCSRCRWGCLDIFTLIYPFSPLSPSLWEMARYRLKYCLKGPLNPKQPTNQLFYFRKFSHQDLIVSSWLIYIISWKVILEGKTIKWSKIELVRAITSTCMHGFQNNFAHVFSLRSSSAI